MSRCNMIVMPLVVFVLTFAASSMGQATIKGNIDLAILMPYDANRNIAKDIKDVWKNQLSANVKLEIGATISIVALQVNDAVVVAKQKISLDVVKTDIEDHMTNPIHSEHNHVAAFDKMMNVFASSSSDRQKVIIAFIPAATNENIKNAEPKAKELRTKGTSIYVIYNKDDIDAKVAAESYAGNASNTIPVSRNDMFSENAIRKISDVVAMMNPVPPSTTGKPQDPKTTSDDTTTIIIVSLFCGCLLLLFIIGMVWLARRRSESQKLREEEAEKLNKMFRKKKQLVSGSLMPSTMGKGKESSVMASKKDGKSMAGGASKMSPSAKSPKK